MSLSLSKKYKVKKRYEYKKIYKASNRLVGNYIFLDFLYNDLDHLRLGITVKSKFAKSNKRNKFKRRIRESFRHLKVKNNLNLDINISPKAKALNSTYKDLDEDLNSLIFSIKK
jgi:ribonuclease P protein component